MKFRWKGFFLFLIAGVLLAALVSVHLSRNNPEQRYADTYTALMVRYRDRMNELTSRPMPSDSMSKDQQRTALAQQVDDIARANIEFAAKLNLLKPPAAFQQAHMATLSLYNVVAEGNHQWAETIRHSNREEREHVLQAAEANEAQALTRLQQALKQAGGESQKLQDLITEMNTKK
jgi:hypothetical protein